MLPIAQPSTPPPFVDVKSFGAVGNGIADDTSNVQAAINSLSAGGIVFFPPGTYKITSTLTLPSGVRLIGSGKGGRAGVTYTYASKLDCSTITATSAISGANNFTAGGLEDLFIQGPDQANVASVEFYGGSTGFYMGYFGTHVVMRNVYLKGFANAIVGYYVTQCQFINVVAEQPRTHCVALVNAQDCEFYGGLMQNAGIASGAQSAANIYIKDEAASNSARINFYATIVDECFNGASSVYLRGGKDISLNNMTVYTGGQSGYGVRLGDGTMNPDRARLNNVRVQPWAPGATITDNIKIFGGSDHILHNVSTDMNGATGGDISDLGTNTTWINVNGIWKLKPTGLGNYANDAAAATGGVPVGGVYRNGSAMMMRVS